MTDSVPALSASILSFSDIALAVRSSFRHGISPFRNEQYHNQGNKATKKTNCYQKVIICTSEPRRLIFDYCGAIFALPEAFFFGYCGAIFALPGAFSLVTAVRFLNGQEALSLTTAAQNMYDLR